MENRATNSYVEWQRRDETDDKLLDVMNNWGLNVVYVTDTKIAVEHQATTPRLVIVRLKLDITRIFLMCASILSSIKHIKDVLRY